MVPCCILCICTQYLQEDLKTLHPSGLPVPFSFVCSLLVILGVGSMAAQLGNEELMERCSRIFKIILAIGVMSLLARFFMLFWGSVFAQALVFALAVLSIFLGFFQYFLYISMLAKAKKMLNE